MGIAGLVFGCLSSVLMVLGLFPCLGAINWLTIPLALVGTILSAVGLSQAGDGGRGPATGGLVLSITAAIIGAFRLSLGGGLL